MAPFDQSDIARQAHQKFHEIMQRETHQIKVCLQGGDPCIRNNFTILHGRERLLKVPRTRAGQTVPEYVLNFSSSGKLEDKADRFITIQENVVISFDEYSFLTCHEVT